MKILLVEDDQRLGKLIHDYLVNESAVVEIVNTGFNIAEKLSKQCYDILILDVMLPKKNGIDICRELRSNNVDIAILFITALNNKIDKIKAFESGADDYLIKPFDFEELLARVKALLRREKKTELCNLTWNNLVMYPEEKKVIYNHNYLHLTPTEFKILQIFLETPNKVFNTQSIIDRLWEIDTTPTDSTLRTHIKSLRKKLEEVGLDKNFIETLYGMGYRLKQEREKRSEKQHQSFNNNKKNIDKISDLLEKNIRENKENQFQNLIKQMWLDNQETVSKDCQELSNYIQGNNNIDINKAINIAHNFVGFLGSLGFDTASKISKNIENLLKENQNNLSDKKVKFKILTLLDTLEKNLFPNGKQCIPKKEKKEKILPKNKIEILVIDEDIKIANNLILFMDNPQVVFHFVHSIVFGIKYLKERQYDVVILETHWEKSSSDQLTDILNFLKEKKEETKTIIYSKNDTLENRLYCSKYPISAFLNKTNTLDVLWENIFNILSNNHSTSNITPLYDILVIDDDIRFTEVLKQKLISNRLPININIISDSEIFLEEIKRIKPQLIILDLQMPKLDGLDICKIIKKDPFLQNIPIIFLTGNLEPDIMNQFVEAGADDFISKSKIDLELYPRIMTHLKRFNLSHLVT
ncbi:response regulator [Geminocystis sp. NIES-3709]|uniref:response regulator transcription factor n=1 Tax=Geminocystis sp. NIES-3709 TaxID=1617448 RepID=UPI0005FCD036|nr:response regulator [Geminocystis sp. NIES-3709]BAQ64798.1 two component Transcriptional regulator [Geminocystis sp. NIES-3709]